MYRHAEADLLLWKSKGNRKPLIIRGARQVGKTYLVREFSKKFNNLIEINFERNPEVAQLFSSNDPLKIVQLLELQFNITIQAGQTLLFLDEIQAQPQIIAVLRYFYEEMPQLHIIAAGSLLEFALESPVFSMPVGRIEYFYLGPLRFSEFLLAMGKEKLAHYLAEFTVRQVIADPIHQQLMDDMRIFLVTGGMPEAMKVYRDSRSWKECEEVKNGILATFQDDFNKYGQRVNQYALQLSFQKIPLMVGRKFKYVYVDPDLRSSELSKALHLLCLARVATQAFHTSANGVPLGAEVNHKKFKIIFLDVGLMASANGLCLLDFEKARDVMLVNKGAVCEQFVGQHLLYVQEYFQKPELYYWAREQKTSSAEIDYLISHGAEIIPVEVKAGSGGRLKSLHLFLKEKERSLGVRFNSEPPSLLETEMALPGSRRRLFSLLSLPLYLVEQTRRLVEECLSG